MLNNISNLISSKFVSNNIISEDVQDVYTYGIEIIISSIIGFVITFIIGLLLNVLMQTMIYYVIFVLLRSMTGGYHASTYFKCNLVFSIITLFVILFSKAIYTIHVSEGILTLLFLQSVAIFIWLAPVENINKPIEKKKKVYWKITSVVISVFLYVLSTLLYINQHIFEAVIIIITIFAVSMLCIIEKIQKGGK